MELAEPPPLNPSGDPNAGAGRTVHSLDGRGVVRDWLVSPAWSAPCDDLDQVLDAHGTPWGPHGRWVLTNGPDVAPLKARLFARHRLLTDQAMPDVVEHGPVSWIRSAGETPSVGVWSRTHVASDGFVDWSRFCFTPEYRHALAATVLEVDQAEYRDLEVAGTGPVAVFLDGVPVLATQQFGYMEPHRDRVRVRLASGTTTVHVATWQVAFRECRHVVSLRVCGPPVRVVLPSPGADEVRSRVAEQWLDSVGVGPWASRDGTVRLHGPAGVRLSVSVAGRAARSVVLDGGRAVVDLAAAVGSGGTADGVDIAADIAADTAADTEGAASMLTTGESELVLRVDAPGVPVTRVARVATLPPRRRDRPTDDDPATWRRELLEHAARSSPGAARALARHTLHPDDEVDPDDLRTGLRMLGERHDCADFEAVALVHLYRRIPPARWREGDRDRVREALTGFKYWIDQPGLDAMCYFTENHQFVWHTAELLAGELFAGHEFTNTGWTGARHAEHAGPLAREWLRRKLTGGFSEFDSNAYLAIDCLALISLVEFAADPDLRRPAEALLDKVLLTLATNSWNGVHGAAHGRSYTHTLRSARFEETAPIMWLLWGLGALNDAVLPATALAVADHYRLPAVVRALARDAVPQWYGRQVYRGEYRAHHDLLTRGYRSDLRVWRTPDAMLSSVQDYRSGLPGLQEHVWGATLASEVQVFATHPAASTISSSARPNAWAGQRILPRVHQDRDTVLVVHRLPDDPGKPGDPGDPGEIVGATHLWFPAELFDEWTQAGCWLAGRVGNGYVAVAADGGLRPQLTGDEAWQCWWPIGDGRAYVATVGRHAVDGPFADFVAALADPVFGGDRAGASVGWSARDGRALHLGWGQAFTVDGRPADLAADGAPAEAAHLDNPACRQEFDADRLDVAWAGERLVLDYASGRRLEPAGGVPVERGRDG